VVFVFICSFLGLTFCSTEQYRIICFLFLHAIRRFNASADSVLVYNGTGILPGVLLQQYPNITSLQAAGLKLRSLSSAFLKSQFFLRNLDLSNNRVAELRHYEFAGVPNLTTLSLAYNNLNKLMLFTFHGLGKLQHLDLSHNLLQNFEAGVFNYLTDLIELWLNNNYLKLVNLALYASMKKLAKLDLSNNQIETIVRDETVEFNTSSYSMEFFDLGDNRLKVFNFMSLPFYGKLTELNLQGNKLTNLTYNDLVARFPNLKTINITGHQLDNSTLETFRVYCDNNGIHLPPFPKKLDLTTAYIGLVVIISGIFVATFNIWIRHACTIRRYQNGVDLEVYFEDYQSSTDGSIPVEFEIGNWDELSSVDDDFEMDWFGGQYQGEDPLN
jgi:Leucine rich repeat